MLTPAAARPNGPLVWIHAGEDGNGRAVLDLALRLVALHPECTVLLTGPHLSVPDDLDDDIVFQPINSDHPEMVQDFVRHWRPDVLVWTWGGFRPNLVLAAREYGVRMILVDAAQDGFDRRRDRWLPEVPRRLLAQFDVVMARSQPAFARLVQLGRPIGDIELVSPLRPYGHTLPANDSDVADVTEALRGRPTWLAAHVHPDEVVTVLAAHRQALKVAHRLLLILLVSDPASVPHAKEVAASRNLNTTLWADGEFPEENAQVLIADAEDELGLWLRVAPVAFFGGSLGPETPDIDPYTAAAHGTAVVYGPYVPTHADAYKRLLDGGGARIVNDASSLGLAVSQMIAPDRAAQMAMAGWDILTEGAQSLDRIVSHVRQHLDRAEEASA
ncbi:MAG: glycosyltransferase N-terminal domain-containing protein [Pseudomonadota bacterium]